MLKPREFPGVFVRRAWSVRHTMRSEIQPGCENLYKNGEISGRPSRSTQFELVTAPHGTGATLYFSCWLFGCWTRARFRRPALSGKRSLNYQRIEVAISNKPPNKSSIPYETARTMFPNQSLCRSGDLLCQRQNVAAVNG